MDTSMISSVLIIAAISLTIGYIVGWLIATLRSDKQAPKAAQAAANSAETPADHRSLLRIWRNTQSGGLLIELRGSRLPEAKDLSLEARRELVDLMKETGVWMGLPTEAAPIQRAATTDRLDALTADGNPVASGVVSAFGPADPAKPSLIDGMTSAIADVVSPVQPARRDAPKSIVQQIDEIFQDKLLGTAFEGQKIYISEDVRKGVIVFIGNSMYEGISAMPEGEVKKLLRASVNEWERRQELVRRRNDKS